MKTSYRIKDAFYETQKDHWWKTFMSLGLISDLVILDMPTEDQTSISIAECVSPLGVLSKSR